MNTKITLPELVARLALTTSTTKRMSELFLRELFATISQTLIDGENVSIKDFGEFKLNQEEGGKKLVYIPSSKLLDTLNQPFEAFVPVEIGDEITEEMLAMTEDAPSAIEPENAGNDACSEDAVLPPPFDPHRLRPDTEPSAEDSEEVSPIENDAEPVLTPLLNAQSEEATVGTTSEDQECAETAEDTGSDEIPQKVEEPESETDMQDEEKCYTITDLEEAKRDAAHHALWKGVMIGACSMLVVSLLAWMLVRPSRALSSASLADIIAVADTTSMDKGAVALEQQPVVTDTTSTTMYLSRMSKKHYGRVEFWVYIYEENKSIIEDPNNIPPGTIVVIPPLSKYGADPNDKASVERAKQLSYQTFGQHSK